ncbi:MAG: Gfo/Idh/MocA family oxidoreductase [Oscillospiraceae bacterium]|jgi:predicted dehydrogenase|nr:Gfo/Idh/MocA family oxidoreductase [Oscillospiraceae bacterium]
MKYKLAIIGCGRISIKHVEACISNSNIIQISAFCDIDIQKAKNKSELLSSRTGDILKPVYKNYQKMIKELNPDIVSIATESGKHAEIAVNCLNLGCHVICEKPMALSTKDADEINKVAKKNKKKIAICFQNRFNPPVKKLRSALEAKKFGKLIYGTIQVRWNRNDDYYRKASWRGTWEMDGGALMNQCIHGIDLLQWMLGEDATRVWALTRRFLKPIEAEDFGTAIIEFKNGAVGIIEGSVDVYPQNLSETLSIFGEKGSVVIGGIAINKIENWNFESDVFLENLKKNSLSSNEEKQTIYGFGHIPLFKNFVESIEFDREPLISGESGRKSLEIVLAAYKSQKTGLPVTLPCDFSTLEMKNYFS